MDKEFIAWLFNCNATLGISSEGTECSANSYKELIDHIKRRTGSSHYWMVFKKELDGSLIPSHFLNVKDKNNIIEKELDE